MKAVGNGFYSKIIGESTLGEGFRTEAVAKKVDGDYWLWIVTYNDTIQYSKERMLSVTSPLTCFATLKDIRAFVKSL